MMRNLIVLGAGRSGTSLVTGLFRKAGYHFGDEPIPTNASNPRGFFEDAAINETNERIIKRQLGWLFRRRSLLGPWHPRVHRKSGILWLAIPHRMDRPIHGSTRDRVREHVARAPFCYKDPRFSITLRHWRRWLPPGTRFVIAYRDPTETAESILRHAVRGRRKPLPVTLAWAYRYWAATYARLLARHAGRDCSLFVRYDRILDRSALARLRRFTGAEVDEEFITPSLHRSRGRDEIPLVHRCREIFRRLERAAAHPAPA